MNDLLRHGGNWFGSSDHPPADPEIGTLYLNTADGYTYVFAEYKPNLLEQIAAAAADVELPKGEWLRVLAGHQGDSFLDTSPTGFFC